MDQAKQISSWNLGVFKEPRGIVKVIQFVLSIFAFATTTSPRTSSSFSVNCNSTTRIVHIPYSYPFDLETVCFGLPVCAGSGAGSKEWFCLPSGAQGPSQFYVFVGVLVFLYCLGAVVLYVVFDSVYKKFARIVVADFIISIILTLLWLISSSIWASGVSNIKENTNPANIGIYEPGSKVVDCHQPGSCYTDSLGNFASLNVSIIFGFLNFLVWLGNLWFLYKETPWFKLQTRPPTQPGAVSETDPQKV